MPHYRAYFLGKDGYFAGAKDLVCGSDEDAIKAAKPLVDCRDVEVWHGDRRVAQLQQDEK